MAGDKRFSGKLFETLGGADGIRALSNCFYDLMDELPEARIIRDMHPSDLTETRENLALFLSGWLGGPQRYREKFGSANLAAIHARFDIGLRERDLWLSCMEQALTRHGVSGELKEHLIERFALPADKIRITCQQQVKGLPVVFSL